MLSRKKWEISEKALKSWGFSFKLLLLRLRFLDGLLRLPTTLCPARHDPITSSVRLLIYLSLLIYYLSRIFFEISEKVQKSLIIRLPAPPSVGTGAGRQGL